MHKKEMLHSKCIHGILPLPCFSRLYKPSHIIVCFWCHVLTLVPPTRSAKEKYDKQAHVAFGISNKICECHETFGFDGMWNMHQSLFSAIHIHTCISFFLVHSKLTECINGLWPRSSCLRPKYLAIMPLACKIISQPFPCKPRMYAQNCQKFA